VAEPILEGTGLRKTYGGVVAVAGVDIRVGAGEILGLVGPNGAGKTTLVDIISGAQSADGGSLKLQGRELKGSAARRARAGLGRTFQHPQLALDLSARDNLLLGRAGLRLNSPRKMVWEVIRGALWPRVAEDDQAVDEIAAELHLRDIDRLSGDLTLGEQRLVEVGRALGQDPTVLLLDEPFAGSDSSGVQGISEVIRIVQRRGHAVILVDHNIDLVAAVVDRMMLLNRGSVAFEGDPRECMSSPEMRAVYFGAGLNVA
jgi:branched-chain amino acid transport system ATP-binding protein